MSAGQQTTTCEDGQQTQVDDTCNIKVEPCEKTKKFFSNFEELFELAKEVQVGNN